MLAKTSMVNYAQFDMFEKLLLKPSLFRKLSTKNCVLSNLPHSLFDHKRIKIVTDNANLQVFKSVKHQQAKLVRWCLAYAGALQCPNSTFSRHPVSAITGTLCYHSNKVNSFLVLVFSIDIHFHTPYFVSSQFSDTRHCLALACNLENNSTFDNKDCSTVLQFNAFSASNISNHSNAHSSHTKEPSKNTPQYVLSETF